MSEMLNTTFGLVPPEIAATLSGLDLLQGLLDGTYPAPPFAETTDLWPISVETGKVVFEARPSKRFYNPMGFVHGGWISLLIDTVMGCAVQSTLKAGQTYTTLEMKTTFVRSVLETTGNLRCEGIMLHSGSRTASAEGKIFDSSGRLVAHGSETCLVMDALKKAG